MHPLLSGRAMQNFDDLDIEGRNPSHLSEEDKEKVNRGCSATEGYGNETNCHEFLSIVHVVVANRQLSNKRVQISVKIIYFTHL